MGNPATSRATAQQRALGLARLCRFLALAVLLVGACNHDLAPPPGTGSGGGESGAVGGDGTGGQGASTTCQGLDTCVKSCSADHSNAAVAGYCNTIGAFTCPADSVRLSSCAADACVQEYPLCCDETSGSIAPPPCGPDGRKQACAAGMHLYDLQAGCIPTGLGTTTCGDLDGKPCSLENQHCRANVVDCRCTLPSDSDTFTWKCLSLLI